MASSERIWARRLRWRFRGAWQWPVFAIVTLADGAVLYLLPPTGPDFDPIFGLFVATFGNLVLVGAVAPWIAKRLYRRAHETGPGGAVRETALSALPREVLRDRAAVALLGAGVLGLVAAGLGNRQVVVSETKATEDNARLVREYVERNGSAEVKRNLQTANARRLEPDFFRTCINLDDRTKAYCLFVDTQRDMVTRDGDTRPNGEAFAR